MPQRDDAAPKTGTAVLKGTVVSAESGKPLRRAQVRAMGTDPRDGRSVSTDENGMWELRELPAGRYSIVVSKGGHVTLSYGQRRPFEQGRPVELADAGGGTGSRSARTAAPARVVRHDPRRADDERHADDETGRGPGLPPALITGGRRSGNFLDERKP